MNYTFDHNLFLWLNFDGGKSMDFIMEMVSGTLMWIPLYLFILAYAWYRYGWKRALAYTLCLVLAIVLSDIICGIFKHSGPLKNLWASFPVRHRPMFDSAVRDLAYVPSFAHGPYGTVSAHAATVVSLAWMSGLMIRRRWYSWFISIAVILICYSRIYLACHFPMDILLGSLVGSAVGVSIYFLWKKFDKVVEKQLK